MTYLDISPSSSSIIARKELCQICGQIGHGKHFGTITCRACAAFFRRAILGNFIRLKCRNNPKSCNANQNGRFECKRCRLEKCLHSGMTCTKIQSDRDLFSCSSSSSPSSFSPNSHMKNQASGNIPVSIESFLGRPHFIVFLDNDLASPVKTMIDVGNLLNKAAEILKEKIPSTNVDFFNGLDNLGKMTFGLNESRKPRSDTIQQLARIGKDESIFIMEEEFLNVARWFTYSDDYQKLPQAAKMNILKCGWQLWARLEKIAMTAELRLKKGFDDNLILATNDYSFDLEDPDIDVSWFTNYSQQQIRYFVDFVEKDEILELLSSLLELQPTPTEQAFMLFQLCLQYAGKVFQGSILEASEKMTDQISNDLHNYYVNELKMPRYSGRLTKLMKVNRIVQKNLMERKERHELARLFDIFTIDFTDPEFIYGYK